MSDTLSQKAPVTLETYRIQPQDILQIRNLQNLSYIVEQPASSGSSAGGATSQGQTYQVEEDGTVGLPAVGHVAVVGLTRSEAQKKVEILYKDSIGIKNPIIELKIINLKVTLMGEIKTQGIIPLVRDKTTLTDVIGQAGGLTDKADATNIKIIRGSQNNPKVIVADLNNINAITSPDNILQNGDIVYITKNKRAIRTDNIANVTNYVTPLLLFLNTALLILSLTRK